MCNSEHVTQKKKLLVNIYNLENVEIHGYEKWTWWENKPKQDNGDCASYLHLSTSNLEVQTPSSVFLKRVKVKASAYALKDMKWKRFFTKYNKNSKC